MINPLIIDVVKKVKNRKILVTNLIDIFIRLSRRAKQYLVVSIDTFIIFITVWMAISIRYDDFRFPVENELWAYLVAVFLGIPIYYLSGLYRSIFRYSGFTSLITVFKSHIIYGILFFIIIVTINYPGIPRSIGILQPMLLLLIVSLSRGLARFWFHPAMYKQEIRKKGEKILIYGAGDAGIQIACALQHNINYRVEGFVDDDELLFNKSINGVIVYSNDSVKSVIKKKEIESILIALPSATRKRRQEIYNYFDNLGIHVRTLPGMEAIAGGKVTVSDIRDIDIEDLLGRDPVIPDSELFTSCIKNKTVLVTGAGGSIGSELCRQIIASLPNSLVLIDNSEYNLYAISKELEERIILKRKNIQLIPVLADVTDKKYIDKIFDEYRPDTVYHAAAYKHVPLVEANPVEGIRNNVFGTLTVTQAAKYCKVKHMVLVSTDKAVRPTNIMGASKRIAELIMQAMADELQEQGICFCMVRFGNVLGSSGSVVPLFRQQIKNGGPVTITHKDVTRYFMTIPEAAQLVIQAGAMGYGGDVFLLDMGEPVKIIDLAKRMIELSGLTVKDEQNQEGDIEIKISGLRPGEKLYEELLIADNPIQTKHPRIFKAHEKYYPMKQLMIYLEELKIMVENKKCDISTLKKTINKIVIDYKYNEK